MEDGKEGGMVVEDGKEGGPATESAPLYHSNEGYVKARGQWTGSRGLRPEAKV